MSLRTKVGCFLLIELTGISLLAPTQTAYRLAPTFNGASSNGLPTFDLYIDKKKFDRISWALVDAVAMPIAPCGYECLSAAEEGRTGDGGNTRGVSRPKITYRVCVGHEQ